MVNLASIRGLPAARTVSTKFSLDRSRLPAPQQLAAVAPQPAVAAQPGIVPNPLTPLAQTTAANTGVVPQMPVSTTAMPTSTARSVNLPALDGSQFVASTTGGGQGASAMDTVGQFAQQFAMQPGESPTSVAQRLASQFGTTPDQLPVEVVQQINNAFQMQSRPSAGVTALDTMDTILSADGAYIRNARRAGLEHANSRGALNSSIGAGAAQREAIGAAMPMFNQAMGLQGQREAQDFQATMAARSLAGEFAGMDRQAIIERGQQSMALAGQLTGQERDAALAQARDAFNAANALSGQREQNAFVGQQAQLDRTQGVNDALLGSALDERRMVTDANLRSQLQSDQVAQQDWLSNRQFQREFNGALSTMAIGSAYDLNRAIMDYAAQNPEVYTPEIISGMTNFFQMNMTGLLQEYFPQLAGGS